MPTKISFRLVPRRALDRPTAWACLISNLFVPGSGTLLAGRMHGYLQLGMTLAAFGLTTLFGMRFVLWFFQNWERLQSQLDPGLYLADTWMAVRWALAGIGLFGIVWLWSLGSSLWILGQTRQPPSVPPRSHAESQGTR